MMKVDGLIFQIELDVYFLCNTNEEISRNVSLYVPIEWMSNGAYVVWL